MRDRVTTTFPREPAAAPDARDFVRDFLHANDVPDEAVEPLVLATAEACNNAIVHASCEAFVVRVTVSDEMCVVSITDRGQGFAVPANPEMPAPTAVGQRGLALMRALVDQVKVASTPSGTTVVLTQGLGVTPGRQPVLADR